MITDETYLLLPNSFFADFGPTEATSLPGCSLGSCSRSSASVCPALSWLPVALLARPHGWLTRQRLLVPAGLRPFGAPSLHMLLKRFVFLIFIILFLRDTCSKKRPSYASRGSLRCPPGRPLCSTCV